MLERSSVAAWEKLADLSVTIDATELGGLITEVPAPFLPTTPGMLSPSPSVMRLESESGDFAESPPPHGLATPSNFGSISQMLLPKFTPSPATHNHAGDRQGVLGVTELDTATSTLLRMQLASMENLAKERLSRITQLEDQLHDLREARKRDAQQLGEQVSHLEERLRENLGSRQPDRSVENHDACRSTLEAQMRLAEKSREQAVHAAISEAARNEKLLLEQHRLQEQRRSRMISAARDSSGQWRNVRDVASNALENLKANREMLAVLRSSLEVYESHILVDCNATAA